MTDNDYTKNPVATAANYVASGVAPGSGLISVASGHDGPWYITEQQLHIDYVRVPDGGGQASSTTIDLTTVTTNHYPVAATKLIAKVTASYNTFLDYSFYSTSSYQQPQTFDVQAAAADPNGVTYGTVSGTSGTVLGPMGSIITDQPFYSRIAYTGTNQPIVAKHINACTFAVWDASTSYTPNIPLIVDSYWQDFKLWKDLGCLPGTHRSGQNPRIWNLNNMYRIFGAYNVSKESSTMINSTISLIGNAVTQLGLFSNPVLINPFGFPVTDTGIAEYSVARHQY
jgi:hypothetical protein